MLVAGSLPLHVRRSWWRRHCRREPGRFRGPPRPGRGLDPLARRGRKRRML